MLIKKIPQLLIKLWNFSARSVKLPDLSTVFQSRSVENLWRLWKTHVMLTVERRSLFNYVNLKYCCFSTHHSYFPRRRFSNVAVFNAVKWTREKPYSDVRRKDLGRSSQGTTSPSFSLFSKNSRVRLEVEVLSRSNIPIMVLSRTAMSLPMERYTFFPFFLTNYLSNLMFVY